MAEPALETTRPTSRETTEDMLQRWSRIAHDNSIVEADQYSQYDVKRGLRHVSGKGVIAGLTQIGDVVGSSAEGDTYVPIPGELIYRGINITDLVHGFLDEGRLGFEETAYLVLFGELPNAEELRRFESQLAERRNLPRHFIHDAVLRMPSRDIMNAMSRGILALYTRDIDPDDISMPALLRQSLDVIAATPLMAVYAFQAYVDQYLNDSLVIHRPNPELGTAENILHMLRRNTRYTALEARVLDLALVLHAEHGGGNNSSFTAHVVSSTGTDTYATIAASLGSLKGPRHGGANIKMVRMFDDLRTTVDDWDDDEKIEEYLLRILDRKAFDRSGLIYGMGHPVYSVSDPRTIILRDYARQLAEAKGLAEEYDLLTKVEQIAPRAIEKRRTVYKGVSANVDFYSGYVYRMLDIPEELYTPLFACARTVGWCAHRIEEIANRGKIIRPAYKSVAGRREYRSLEER